MTEEVALKILDKFENVVKFLRLSHASREPLSLDGHFSHNQYQAERYFEKRARDHYFVHTTNEQIVHGLA